VNSRRKKAFFEVALGIPGRLLFLKRILENAEYFADAPRKNREPVDLPHLIG
jgi:hypothetical protein